MAKRPKSSKSGSTPQPQLSVAVFCEKAIQDGAGVYTIIRVVDSLTLSARELPPKGAIVPLPITGLFGFRSNGIKGRFPFLLTQIAPSGAKTEIAGGFADLKGGVGGAYISAANLPLLYEKNGTYWYEVRLSGRLYATMPLKVSFEAVPDPHTPSGQSLPKTDKKAIR